MNEPKRLIADIVLPYCGQSYDSVDCDDDSGFTTDDILALAASCILILKERHDERT